MQANALALLAPALPVPLAAAALPAQLAVAAPPAQLAAAAPPVAPAVIAPPAIPVHIEERIGRMERALNGQTSDGAFKPRLHTLEVDLGLESEGKNFIQRIAAVEELLVNS